MRQEIRAAMAFRREQLAAPKLIVRQIKPAAPKSPKPPRIVAVHRPRGNPNWAVGKQRPLREGPCQFDIEVERLGLHDPREQMCSVPLRLWASRNRNKRYVPEWLLEIWGIDAKDDFSGVL